MSQALQTLEQNDILAFQWVNSHHTPCIDWVMWVSSQHWSWAIVLTAAICFLCYGKRIGTWLWVLAGVGLCFLLSDRISVLCFKDVFCRLRPCHALEDVRMFQTSCGGLYGFVSSHAANVFALALFLSLRHVKGRSSHPGKRSSSFIHPLLLFLWACLVCYSRPYLGKHYPGDVICGAMLGLMIGTLVFFFVQYAERWADSLIARKKNTRK